MKQYRCETCKNQDDCAEWKYTSVRDVSVRCGLVCHSDFQSERDKVLDELIKKSHVTTNSDYFEGKRVVLISDIEELRQAGEP
jgi:hypothetical protein